jgi:hypothetical protein
LLVVLLGFAPIMVRAQSASPAAATPVAGTPIVPIASGLTNPRGFIWGPDGTLYVALAGSGGSAPATEQAPTSAIIGPFTGGLTGALAKIDSGCPVAVATGLASTLDGMGEVLGAEDVAMLGGELYVSVDGGGPVHGNADHPSGIYKVAADGSTTIVADLSAYLRANPVKTAPGDYDPDADGYRMAADETAGALWVLEPNSQGVLSVKPDGTITRVADLSDTHPVPASIALVPGGGAVYVGMLTGVPFADGSAKVIKVMADGTVSDVWTNLTTVTGLAVGPDGTLYAAEMSTGNLAGPPFLVPGSGKVVKQTGMNTSEDVATGLMLPVSLGFGPDGGLYASMPAIGANGGEGMIAWVGGATPGDVPTAASCLPIAETLSPMMATPAAATPIS